METYATFNIMNKSLTREIAVDRNVANDPEELKKWWSKNYSRTCFPNDKYVIVKRTTEIFREGDISVNSRIEVVEELEEVKK